MEVAFLRLACVAMLARLYLYALAWRRDVFEAPRCVCTDGQGEGLENSGLNG